MKKVLVFMFIFILMTFSVFAEDDASTSDEASSEGSENTDPIVVLDIVIPKFPAIKSINDAMIQSDLDILTNHVAVLRDDYLDRIAKKIDVIVQNYTNANFISSNDIGYANLNVYEIVANTMAADNNVGLAVGYSTRALSDLNRTRPSLIAIGKTEEANQIEYHLNLYAGIINMYAGSKLSLRKSLENFKYILDNPMNDEDPQMYTRLNSYIAAINYELLQSELGNDILRKQYYNNIFDALWNIVESSSDSDEIKEGKYYILLNQFESVLFTNTENFRKKYSVYIKKQLTGGSTSDTTEETSAE